MLSTNFFHAVSFLVEAEKRILIFSLSFPTVMAKAQSPTIWSASLVLGPLSSFEISIHFLTMIGGLLRGKVHTHTDQSLVHHLTPDSPPANYTSNVPLLWLKVSLYRMPYDSRLRGYAFRCKGQYIIWMGRFWFLLLYDSSGRAIVFFREFCVLISMNHLIFVCIYKICC